MTWGSLEGGVIQFQTQFFLLHYRLIEVSVRHVNVPKYSFMGQSDHRAA